MDNLLENINLGYRDIEKQIRNYKLKFLRTKLKSVEYNSFPLFVESFYDILQEEGRVPFQKEFSEYYFNKHKDKKSIIELNSSQIKGLKARLYRAYPSYVRDIHFALFLKDKTVFDEIIYNIFLDTKKGIDILINDDNLQYAISLYTNTKRSKKFRKEKIGKHTIVDNYIYIELPIEFKGSRQVGEFYLYSYRELTKLFNTILKSKKEVG